MIYLASPYSHPDPAIREVRYDNVLETLSQMARLSLDAFSPIAHWHETAKRYELPTDAKYWKSYNMIMQARCDRTAVLLLTGWQESRGVKFEVANSITLSHVLYTVDIGSGLTRLSSARELLPQFTIEAGHGTHNQERDSGRGNASDPLAR